MAPLRRLLTTERLSIMEQVHKSRQAAEDVTEDVTENVTAPAAPDILAESAAMVAAVDDILTETEAMATAMAPTDADIMDAVRRNRVGRVDGARTAESRAWSISGRVD